jgi:hypothetical protein
MIGIDEHGEHRRLRGDLAQQLEPLGHQLDIQGDDAGGIAARPVHAGDKAQLHRRVGDQEVDRHGIGRGLCRDCRRRAR